MGVPILRIIVFGGLYGGPFNLFRGNTIYSLDSQAYPSSGKFTIRVFGWSCLLVAAHWLVGNVGQLVNRMGGHRPIAPLLLQSVNTSPFVLLSIVITVTHGNFPKYTIILILVTPKKVALILGKYHIPSVLTQ